MRLRWASCAVLNIYILLIWDNNKERKFKWGGPCIGPSVLLWWSLFDTFEQGLALWKKHYPNQVENNIKEKDEFRDSSTLDSSSWGCSEWLTNRKAGCVNWLRRKPKTSSTKARATRMQYTNKQRCIHQPSTPEDQTQNWRKRDQSTWSRSQ